MKARIAAGPLLWFLLSGCNGPNPRIDKTNWPDLRASARPTILRDPQAPDRDFQEWQEISKRRAAEDAERLAKQPKVTAAFADLAIRDALLEISDQAKIPVVTDPSVTGTVTLNLVNVPFESAVRLIAFAGNYAYSTDGHAFYVGTLDPASPSYATLTTTRIVSTNLPPKEIAASLNKAYAAYVSFSEAVHKIVLTGPSSVLDRLEADIRTLDRSRPQILIEVMVVETKSGSDVDFGFELARIESTLEQTYRRTDLAGTPDVSTLDLITRLAATFDVLSSRNVARIRSHPKVVTSDGVPAEIRSLVESYVVITRPGLNFLTSNLEIIRSGTSLKVTPSLTRTGEIELVLEPEVADVIGISSDVSGSLPVISRRGVKSTVRVKNADVVVIGGLYEESMRNVRRGIPLLKDIPVVNVLLSREIGDARETELLIFVSPKVIQ
ncbi:MAG: hypothetical protein HYY17_10155 [Planctomycetes bacterium]|nr:hypothetical protein [Planctomycetota bacterium]